MESKLKYIIVNGDGVLGMVYENEKYGRTMVIQGNIDSNFPIQIFDYENNNVQVSETTEVFEFLHGLLPRN